MPSPVEILTDPMTYLFYCIYAAFFIWEYFFPAKPQPKSPLWHIRGIIAFTCYLLIANYLPLYTDEWLAGYQLIDATFFPIFLAVPVGLLIYELGLYIWHRIMHSYKPLWRVFHQMHHSAERFDTMGAFWFSPMDMIGFTLLFSLCFNLIIGLPLDAVILIAQITFTLAVFQHTNVNTPRWLGNLVQRPESHSLHHATGVHYYNFSDLPVWDMMFGTFKNPRKHSKQHGYYPDGSLKVPEMLVWKDINPKADVIRTDIESVL